MEEDILAVIDRDETVSLMEPLLISDTSKHRGPLSDLALELAAQSARLRGSLPAYARHSLADLVRAMNCYYSNLIEGHDTHPVDIERALKNDYSTNTKQRNFQLEAKAHITVQKWIDEGGIKDHATTVDGLREIHTYVSKAGLNWISGSGHSFPFFSSPSTTSRISGSLILTKL